jgi:anaerobic magnesium-protoporphyrin IX monomethyl ester cyclase
VKVLLVIKSKMMENLGVMYLKSVIQHNCQHECIITDLPTAAGIAGVWQPEIVGMSIMTGDMEKFHALEYSLHKKKKAPTIIVGGCDPTFFPEGYGWADMIIKGEAEQQMADLLKTGQKYDGIDALPWPARDDFPGMKVRDFVSSRNCPFSCSYCFNSKWNEALPENLRGVRTRSVDDVIKEIEDTVKHHGTEYVFFQDSCFGVKMSWMEQFSIEYRDRVNLPWQCNFRPEQITEERARLLKDCNCVAVRMALESASNRLRGLIGRTSIKLKTVREASTILRMHGIQLMLQNIIALPESTIEDDLFTLEQNIIYKPTYSWCSIFVPYPGTVLGDMCIEKGWYKGGYGKITDSFFDKSVLEFSEEYKEQTYCLQKVFAFCVEVGVMPEIDDLTINNLPKFIHKAMRKLGDKRLYVGIL